MTHDDFFVGEEGCARTGGNWDRRKSACYGESMTTKMRALSDVELVAELKALVVKERALSAAMLAYLAEVDARQLYLSAACSSIHVYCVSVLGMSEEVAFKRIRAARAVRKFPVVLEAVAEGRLNVSAVVRISPHLTEENAKGLVEEVSGLSRAAIDLALARRAPKPDVAQRLEPEPRQPPLVDPDPPPPAPLPKPRVTALAPERFALQLTLGGETKAKLERAQALLRHQVPSGDLAQVLDRALDALLEKVETRKFGKVAKPRAARKSESRRHVPAAVRRDVVARDGERCSFVSDDGRRCEETGFLELDHVVPVAWGGEPTVEGVRVLCRSHNQFEARRVLGREAVEAGKTARQMDDDVMAGLKGMGVTSADARRAIAESRGQGTTIEERLRAALRVLHTIYARQKGWRCEEAGPSWSQGGRSSSRRFASEMASASIEAARVSSQAHSRSGDTRSASHSLSSRRVAASRQRLASRVARTRSEETSEDGL